MYEFHLQIESELTMKVILFLTFSATASALQETEEMLSDELNDWNPTWKKGLIYC